jgi:biotin carboxyl carrier protein
VRVEATADGATHTVEIIEGEGTGLVQAKIGEREYLVEVVTPAPGLYLLVIEGRVFPAHVFQRRGKREVQIGHWSASIEVALPRRPGSSPKAAVSAGGRQEVTAPMPGRVVQVLVQPGATVQEGAGVVIIEAMKMETEIRSPLTGQAKEIRVEAGMTVETGQVLLVIENG